MIVGSLIDRMVKVVCPRVECQFVEGGWVEAGTAEQITVGRTQQLQRPFNNCLITPHSGARAANVERYRSHSLVGVRLDAFRFQHRDWPITDKVIQLSDRAVTNTIDLFPRGALAEHGLANATEEERIQQIFVLLVEQQIAVELPVGG